MNSSAKGSPAWTRDPYNAYEKAQFAAAVGIGDTRQMAEKNALGNLVATFGQSIMVDEKISLSYQEAVKSGATANWSENTSIDSTIKTGAGLDSLVGAEIGEVWYDGKKDYYAVAILEKPKAIQTYSNMIRSNQAMINELLNMPAAGKNTLDGYARYQFAATVADINISYGNLLSVIGAPSYAQGLKRGDDYRLEAKNIANAIPIGITVKNDRAGRVQGAFAKILADAGFRSGGTNTRYRLDASLSLTEDVRPGQPNIFVRYVLDASLVDTEARGTVLVPYNVSDRAGHNSLQAAEDRAYLEVERKIDKDFRELLSNYLSQLLPKK
jgi:hypothetical protein